MAGAGDEFAAFVQPWDESVWEELEEVLVSSDVGVETSLEIVDGLRKRAREDRLGDPEQLFQALKESLVQDLDSGEPEDLRSLSGEHASPYVILMVGVNGVGKDDQHCLSWPTTSSKQARRSYWERRTPSGRREWSSWQSWRSGWV